MGFFAPGDVNDHMSNWMKGKSATPTQGFSEMIFNWSGRLVVGFSPVRYFEIQALVEGALAPKILTVVNTEETHLFNFLRISGGALGQLTWPIPSSTFALLLGGGPIEHYMVFEDYNASTLGWRAQIGVRIFATDRLTVDGLVSFDYAVGKTGKPKGGNSTAIGFSTSGASVHPPEMELNYSGVSIGGNVYWSGL